MRKRLTQIFPMLLPIRKKQKLFCFYVKMGLDSNTYTTSFMETMLPYTYYKTSSALINKNTGFDLKYQSNKAFNLRLASVCIDKVMIQPNETFSLWKMIRNADKIIKYKEGLTVVNGETMAAYGGGLCQLSNLLFDLFLHSPLVIKERHGHRIKEFLDTSNDSLKGTDATIAEGWLDLKVYNDTDQTFQIEIKVDENEINATLYCDKEIECNYLITNENLRYYYRDDACIEEVDVVRFMRNKYKDTEASREVLYTNRCVIAYQLPKDIEIEGK